jgi:hypothetical protein
MLRIQPTEMAQPMGTRDRTTTAVGLLTLFSAWVAAGSPAAAAGKPAEIPFTLAGGYIIVEAELAPGHMLPFMFDSGLSGGNLISAEAAKAMGLATKGEVNVQDVSGNGDSAELTNVPRIRVGDAVLTDQTFAIAPAPHLAQREGQAPLAGLLGAPLMRGAVVCIDYQQKVLRRWPRAGFDDSQLSSVPMRLNHGLPTIGMRIDGRHATMVADSGNNSGVEVYPAFAKKNNIRKRYPDLAVRHGVGGSGQTFEILLGVAGAVAVGPQTVLHQVPLLVVPQAMDPAWGIDGMAGFEFLSRLNPCLDRDGHRLLWNAKQTVSN